MLSDLIRIVTEGAVFDTVRSVPLFLLEDYDIGHVVGCKRWAIGITLTICKERYAISAHDTILIFGSIAETTSFMAADVTNLNVFVPF